MSDAPNQMKRVRSHLDKLISVITPNTTDPTYIILKAHLLAEGVLYRFIARCSHHPSFLDDARLGFSQLLVLSRSFHLCMGDDWWGWLALKKLNSLRNLIAHNLEPGDLRERIVDFSIYVAEAIGATTDSEIGKEYERLAKSGSHPFILALVALHVATCVTLGFDPEEHLGKQVEL